MSKTITDLIGNLKNSPLKVAEFSKAIEHLENNHSNLQKFLDNNVGILEVANISAVSQYIINVLITGIDSRIQPKILKNIFDEYSLIFILNMFAQTNNKTHRNKLSKILRDVLYNSSKFDIYTKVKVNTKLIMDSENVLFETFWLIPLMVNIDYLIKMEYSVYIDEMVDLSVTVPGFVDGYQFYVTSNYAQAVLNKDAFKQFLLEASK